MADMGDTIVECAQQPSEKTWLKLRLLFESLMVQVLDLVCFLHLQHLAKNPEVFEVLDGMRLHKTLKLLRNVLISIQMGEVHQFGDV